MTQEPTTEPTVTPTEPQTVAETATPEVPTTETVSASVPEVAASEVTAPTPEAVTPESAPEPTPTKTPLVSNVTLSVVASGAILFLALGSFSLWTIASEVPPVPQVASVAAMDVDEFEDITLLAKSAYVFDVANQKPLFALNADAQLPLASITKLALVLAAAEVLDPKQVMHIPRGAVERGEGGGLGTGDMWRIQDLIDFTLVVSSNAGAEALAEAADGRLAEKYPHLSANGTTVARMNALMAELGLTQTYFLNPSGLDISPTQASAYSSARETAIFAAYAAQTMPDVFSRTTDPNPVLGPLNGNPIVAKNTNQALAEISGIVLGKTGFTDLAGGNLVVVFEAGPARPIAAVVLGSTNDGRFEDMKKLVAATQETILAERSQEGLSR
jgi:D-alanyl-D-alanine carboxypeptidase